MKIVFAGTTLLDTTVAPSTPWIQGNVTINGTNVADVAPLAQATQVSIFDRGNRSNTVVVKVRREFADFPTAQNAFFTTHSLLPGSGVLTITCGEIGNTPQTVTGANAVLQSTVPELLGVQVIFTYTIVCGLLTTGTPPGYITVSPLALEVIQVAVTSGSATVAVTFPTPYGGAVIPTVQAIVGKPTTASPNLTAEVDLSTLNNTGATFKLSSPAPTTGYILHVYAAA